MSGAQWYFLSLKISNNILDTHYTDLECKHGFPTQSPLGSCEVSTGDWKTGKINASKWDPL